MPPRQPDPPAGASRDGESVRPPEGGDEALDPDHHLDWDAVQAERQVAVLPR